jgi:hypothetical protein
MADSTYLMTDGMTPSPGGEGFVLLPPDDPVLPTGAGVETDARMATIETLARTAQEQATATRAEMQRSHEQWAQERATTAQQQDRMTSLIETLAARLAQPAASTAPPPLQFGDIIEEVALNPGKKELANQYMAQVIAQVRQELTSAPGLGTTRAAADTTRPMTVSEYEARTASARLQQQLVNDFATRHSDVLNNPDARTALLQRYGTLTQDPMTRAMYPPDPQGVTQIELMGQRWDLRVLDRAAADITQAAVAHRGQRQQQLQQGQDFPTQGGGATVTRPAEASAPQYIPQGTVNLLKLPAMHQALASLFQTTDPRSIAKEVLQRSPRKEEWQHQAALAQAGRR